YCLSAHVFKDLVSVRTFSAIGAISGFLFINYLLMHALRQPGIFSGLSADEAQLAETETPGRAALVSSEDAGLLRQLDQHMTEARPYLDADLSVDQLAHQIGEIGRAHV